MWQIILTNGPFITTNPVTETGISLHINCLTELRSGDTSAENQRRFFHHGFVPKGCVNERLKKSGSSFYQEGLDLAMVEQLHQLGQHGLIIFELHIFHRIGYLTIDFRLGVFLSNQDQRGLRTVKEVQRGGQPTETVGNDTKGLRT